MRKNRRSSNSVLVVGLLISAVFAVLGFQGSVGSGLQLVPNDLFYGSSNAADFRPTIASTYDNVTELAFYIDSVDTYPHDPYHQYSYQSDWYVDDVFQTTKNTAKGYSTTWVFNPSLFGAGTHEVRCEISINSPIPDSVTCLSTVTVQYSIPPTPTPAPSNNNNPQPSFTPNPSQTNAQNPTPVVPTTNPTSEPTDNNISIVPNFANRFEVMKVFGTTCTGIFMIGLVLNNTNKRK